MDRILQLFKDPEHAWVTNTLNWWNKYTFCFLLSLWLTSFRQVDFSRSKTSGGETDTSSDNEHSVPIEDLLRSADDEEFEVYQDDDQGSNHDNDDTEWPDTFRMNGERPTPQEREVAAAQEQEVVAARARDAAAREREVTSMREREIAAGHEREAVAAREVAAVREREAAREQEVAMREREAAREREAMLVRERDSVATTTPGQDPTSSGKRPIEPDLSELSDEEPLPPPQPVRTKQTNRGTGRQPPPKKKRK